MPTYLDIVAFTSWTAVVTLASMASIFTTSPVMNVSAGARTPSIVSATAIIFGSTFRTVSMTATSGSGLGMYGMMPLIMSVTAWLILSFSSSMLNPACSSAHSMVGSACTTSSTGEAPSDAMVSNSSITFTTRKTSDKTDTTCTPRLSGTPGRMPIKLSRASFLMDWPCACRAVSAGSGNLRSAARSRPACRTTLRPVSARLSCASWMDGRPVSKSNHWDKSSSRAVAALAASSHAAVASEPPAAKALLRRLVSTRTAATSVTWLKVAAKESASLSSGRSIGSKAAWCTDDTEKTMSPSCSTTALIRAETVKELSVSVVNIVKRAPP